MFDYSFDCEDKMQEEISNMKDENIKDFIFKIAYESKLKAAAEEYEKIHGKEVVDLYNEFCEERKGIKDHMKKIAFLLDDNIVGYVLDIIYDIVKDTEKEMYDLGYEDGKRMVDEEVVLRNIGSIDFYVDTSKGYCDTSYYKPVCDKKDIDKLLKCGLCCAVCRNYSHGRCWNKIYTEFTQPEVEPYQICECVKFDGKKYSNFYFDGCQYCKRGNQKVEHRGHFSDVTKEAVERLKNELKEKEDFIYFFMSEIPEVYRKMMGEFKKRKEISK